MKNETREIRYTTLNGIVVPELCDILDYIEQHGGASEWGQITGNIQNQTDLIRYIDEHRQDAEWGHITGSILNQTDLEAILRGLRNQINILDETKADVTALENMVTTNTLQEISGAKNFTGALTQNNDPVVTTTMLTTKQNIYDDNLQTTDKTIVGAINEVNARSNDSNVIVVIQNTDSTRTATLTNLVKDVDGHPILQVNIGYKSSMTNEIDKHLDIVFNHTDNTILSVYTNGIDFTTGYFHHEEFNTYINKFVVAVRKTEQTSDTRDIYIEFSQDGNSATITFAKTGVNYIVGSRLPK